MESNRDLPFVVSLDDCDDPADVIDALTLGAFAAGREPMARTIQVNRVRPAARLLPANATATWSAVSSGRTAHLARGDGWTLRAVRWTDHSARITVTAVTDELARRVLREATEGASELVDDDGRATVGFWHQAGSCNPHRMERDIAISPWSVIRHNYGAATRSALEAVMLLTPADLAGRLLLLHGPPGTGKTTALRSLAHAWRSWCAMDVVLDPERLLADAGYLMNVALGEDGDDRWRLVVLEDCDELVRSDAKRDTGQSLARLLNLTDGIVGQGMKVLVAITTNEPIHQLHPAIVRAGRCLAEVAVGPLSRSEAGRWLGPGNAVPPDGATLAELLVLRGELHKVEERSAPSSAGQYL